MFRNPIYRVLVDNDPANHPSRVGEFDDLAQAIDHFTQVLEAHVAEIEKGAARVLLIAE